MAQLDDVDLRLLTLLQEDGRSTQAALAKAVGLSGPSVYARIKRLESEGVIQGYSAILAPESLGQALVAFIRVGTMASPDEQEPFESYVERSGAVLECHDVDGEDSYVVKVRVGSPQELRVLLAEIRALPGVSRTVSSIVLQTVKEIRGGAHLAEPSAPGSKSEA
ncbi:Lrp/AsnC family transcriptional regulator [Actinokineospora iranica]|uniref:Transcriptional regulator, AsnC family n=1 Tax=Actinokineospora iranica TaxID=1271860 RepID=A0A1G6JV03_9PSEU|nr:Lrp/AsnC family transcriptional regulator [Actinokineospora iranica]SDC22580.1 transcriptional regulator, AsnC family [Actinokineospora iranica]